MLLLEDYSIDGFDPRFLTSHNCTTKHKCGKDRLKLAAEPLTWTVPLQQYPIQEPLISRRSATFGYADIGISSGYGSSTMVIHGLNISTFGKE